MFGRLSHGILHFIRKGLRIGEGIKLFAIFKKITAGNQNRLVGKIVADVLSSQGKQFFHIGRLGKKRRPCIKGKSIFFNEVQLTACNLIFFMHLYLKPFYSKPYGSCNASNAGTYNNGLSALHCSLHYVDQDIHPTEATQS